MAKQKESKKTARAKKSPKKGTVRIHKSHPGQDPMAVAKAAFTPTRQDLHNMKGLLAPVYTQSLEELKVKAQQAKEMDQVRANLLKKEMEQRAIPMPVSPSMIKGIDY